MKKSKNSGFELIKSIHPGRPSIDYFVPKEDKKLREALLQPSLSPKGCQMVCSKTVTLLPKTNLQGGHGVGYYQVNVDGFRYINAYIISDPLKSSLQRGFSLELEFSLNPFVPGVGFVGLTSYFFNFDNYYDTVDLEKKIINCATSDLQASGYNNPSGVGSDLAHILRVPVMGPYVYASAFNNDNNSQNVEVRAYLTT